jgi:arsenate reductase (thioredoxin)
MLLFGKSGNEPEVKRQEEKIVLFVCIENAARSQIAESFFRKYAPRGYMTVSGGTRPIGQINPELYKQWKKLELTSANKSLRYSQKI